MLGERDASPVQLAQHLEARLGTIAYHVRTLERLGLIEMVATYQRRGATEHVYKACPHPLISDQAWAEAPQIAKQAMVSATLAQAGEYATRSSVAGGFDRPDAYAARVAMQLDEQGWSEIADAVRRMREEIKEIETRSEERLKDTHDEPLDVGFVMLLFEALPFFTTSPTDDHSGAAKPRKRAELAA